MKRYFYLVILTLIFLVTSACSANTIEAACEKADNFVRTWDAGEGSSCNGTYEESSDSYIVVVDLGESIYSNLSPKDNTWDMMTYAITEAIQNKYYPELKEIFSNFDTDVLVGVKDCYGNLTCIIDNDKILDAR